MDKIQELKAARAAKIDELDVLVGKMNGDDYVESADDDAAYDALKADIASIDKKIERAEEANRLKATIAVPVDTRDAGSAFRMPARAAFYTPKNIKRVDGIRLTPQERAYRAGQFFLASVWGNEKAAEWCRENGIAVQKAQSEGVASAGGVLVPDEVSSEIITLRDAYGLFRRSARVWPMARDTLSVPKWSSGLSIYFTGEGVAATESQAVLGQVELVAKKASGLALYSSELDEDAIVNMGDFLIGELAYAFANKEDSCGFIGDGSATYGGMMGVTTIFNNNTSYAGAAKVTSGNDTMAEITAADLAIIQGKLPTYVYQRGNPRWYCSQTVWANVFERLIGASGGVTKDQATGMTTMAYNGYPVEISPVLLAPAATTTDFSDATFVLFGDLAMASAFGDRRGMTVARSTEYKFAEDQIAIKATERFQIVNHGVGDASAAGPIVAGLGN